MSSPRSQESPTSQSHPFVNAAAHTQPGPTKDDPSVPFKVGNKANAGLDVSTIDKTSPGTQNASGTSETRSGEDLSSQQDVRQKGYVGKNTGTEGLIDSIEGSMQEGGEAGHQRQVHTGESKEGKKRTEPLWRGIHFSK